VSANKELINIFNSYYNFLFDVVKRFTANLQIHVQPYEIETDALIKLVSFYYNTHRIPGQPIQQTESLGDELLQMYITNSQKILEHGTSVVTSAINQSMVSNYSNSLYTWRPLMNNITDSMNRVPRYIIGMRDELQCKICAKLLSLNQFHIDHIIPKSKFPSSHLWNLQVLCPNCNKDKSDEILDQIPLMLKGAKKRTEFFFKNNLNQINNLMNQYYSTIEFGDLTTIIINKIIKSDESWDKTLKSFDLDTNQKQQ